MTIFPSQNSQVEIDARTNSNHQIFSSLKLATGLIGWCAMSNSLAAQVSPDNSLGTETSTEDNVTEITGGTRREGNLFHSFQDFSVETDGTAFFNNGTDISNIIGRVTGSSISNIDGLIRANGEANLILINPNGISFGSNARLDIGGAFLGSTAESVVFGDGSVFNTDLDTPPLLTISTPVGLQLGQPAEITLSGTADSDISVAGTTFALVGNGIAFDGGIVSAESGRIELGSVAQGEVSIESIAAGWQLGYAGVTEFAPLELLGGSALLNPNTSANSTGGIQVYGSEITLERSQISAETLADAPGGNVVINASESLALTGTAQMGANASQISNNVAEQSAGEGGSIEITTGRLNIDPRSFIDNSVFGAGTAGNIEIVATEIDLNGAGFEEFQQQYRLDALEGNLEPGSRITGIFAGTATTGSVGDINITTDTLNLSDGAIIFAPVFTAGSSGDLNITATEIDLNASAIQLGAAIESIPTASVGNINLQSDRLNVANGAAVINATFGNAPGGDLNISASAIDLNTASPESILGTGLYTNTSLGNAPGGDLKIIADTIKIEDALIASNSGSLLPNGTVIPFGGLGGNIEIQAKEITASGIIFDAADPSLSVGAGIGTSTYSPSNGGNFTIDTSKLTIEEGASFASATFGAGNGGQLIINATDSVELNGFASDRRVGLEGLFASSGNTIIPTPEITGASGNISITTPNLQVINGATIDVRSTNVGGAGSITLTTDSTFIGQGSSLSATTQDGAGGNIEIDTKTLQLDRGLINASVSGRGTGGNIEIVASDSMRVSGSGFEALRAKLFDPERLSPEFLASLELSFINEGILAASVTSGDAGKIDIQSENLEIVEGGLIATATAGSGSAGTIFLNTSNLTIDASFISNNTLFDGQSGDVEINTHQLEILQGGQITVSTLGSGDGGNVEINARQSVTVAGDAGFPQTASNISVGAGAVPLTLTTGNGGDLIVNTPELNIDGGAISIGSIGSGDAGRLEVDADSITIDNQGSISADTESGSGGNLLLEADNILWRGQSTTTATARGSGDGGNITINADNLVALENSNVTADAFMRGMGGNIQIDTRGLYLCQTCQVTASSQLGLDGVVNIETLEPNTTLNLLDIPQQPTQPQEEVAVACPSEPGNSTSRLTITGRGGIPNRPQELLSERSLIEFDAPDTAIDNTNSTPRTIPAPARGWYRNDRGQIMLTARSMGNSIPNSAIKALDCHD